MSKTPPLVAFLSDFGLHDHYAGTVKAVLLSINPVLHIVDITHEVRPRNVREAGYLLWASYRFFPDGTIFVAVVDPGVGTERAIVALRTERHLFLAPENGLLDFVLCREEIVESVAVDLHKVEELSRAPLPVSATFHGRDVFAPVAARLSLGDRLSEFGEPVTLARPPSPFLGPQSASVPPAILHVDRFGNVVTNIEGRDEEFIRARVQGVIVRGKRITRWVRTFQEASSKAPSLLTGSSGLVEIVMKNRNAARWLGVGPSTPLALPRRVR